MRAVIFAGIGAGCLLGAATAQAHVEISPDSGAAGDTVRLALEVEHGCSGAATTAIRVRLDDRILTARPMPKPGWTVQVTQNTVKRPDGSSLQVPREIAWTGGSIPGDFYDEFVMLVVLPQAPPGSVIYFPVLQECGGTTVRWIEMPLANEDPDSLDTPAPAVTLSAGKTPDHAAADDH